MLPTSTPARPHHATIGPNRVTGWAWVLAQSAITAAAPLIAGGSGTGRVVLVPLITGASFVAVALCWQRDLAPRLAFNEHGIAVRSGWLLARFGWDEVEYTWLVAPPGRARWLCLQVTGGRRMFIEYRPGDTPRLEPFQRARQAYRAGWLAGTVPASTVGGTPGGGTGGRAAVTGGSTGPGRTGAGGREGPPTLSRYAPLVGVFATWAAGLAIQAALR